MKLNCGPNLDHHAARASGQAILRRARLQLEPGMQVQATGSRQRDERSPAPTSSFSSSRSTATTSRSHVGSRSPRSHPGASASSASSAPAGDTSQDARPAIRKSRGGCRMADTTPHRVDRVLRSVLVRQWVFTPATHVRRAIAFNGELRSQVPLPSRRSMHPGILHCDSGSRFRLVA